MKKRYNNHYIKDIRRDFVDFVKWQVGLYDDLLPLQEPPLNFSYPFPVTYVDKNLPQATWINHSTFLIEAFGVNILTDPIWSKRCSPFSFLGPKRRHDAPFEIEELPTIDIVVISHNHYDHLDYRTIKELFYRFPEILFIVPKGVKKWFLKKGFTNVIELTWWEETPIVIKSQNLEIIATAVPAQHHSGRGFFDANKTLWMGLMLQLIKKEGAQKTLYFVGDTGYNSYDFKRIGETFKEIDLCLCPIGSYKPTRFMQSVHISPDEAVNIHKDVKAKLSLGMHWKTFKLGDEGMHQPPYDLFKAMTRRGLPPETFLPIEPGMKVNW